MVVMNPATVVETGKYRFLIIDAPSNENIQHYLTVMKAQGVSDLVRTCEPTYDDGIVRAAGIRCHEMIFADGDPPPPDVIDSWLDLVEHVAAAGTVVAVHCVAGLGRAPALVAVALIEFAGFDPLDAIDFVRARRKGAINKKQLQYLRVYKRRTRASKQCCGLF